MQVYEIRILHADRSTAIVIEMMHLSDAAAVRAGKKIAEARPFELWRELDCIYGEGHSSPPVDRVIPRRRTASQP